MEAPERLWEYAPAIASPVPPSPFPDLRIDRSPLLHLVECQDTILLNRCILDEVKRDLRLENDETVDKLRVNFQLERSSLRKQRREVPIPNTIVMVPSGVLRFALLVVV